MGGILNKKILLTGVVACFVASGAHAQGITLSSASASPGGAGLFRQKNSP
jgi:hypothetical protein